jgi:hypothetical protein
MKRKGSKYQFNLDPDDRAGKQPLPRSRKRRSKKWNMRFQTGTRIIYTDAPPGGTSNGKGGCDGKVIININMDDRASTTRGRRGSRGAADSVTHLGHNPLSPRSRGRR